MNVTLFGLPALIVWVGFLVVGAMPVWLAARLVGAERPTLLRAILSLIAGLAATLILAALTGGWALLLSPLVFLLSFKFVLGTSFLGAVLLAILAAAGYAAIAHFATGGVNVSDHEIRSSTQFLVGQFA